MLAQSDRLSSVATPSPEPVASRSGQRVSGAGTSFEPDANLRVPLLRVPPFPGSRSASFSCPAAHSDRSLAEAELDETITLMRRFRVGGSYWGAQPALPDERYTLVRIRDCDRRAAALREGATAGRTVCLLDSPREARSIPERIDTLIGPCDPWYLLSGASEVVVDPDDEVALLATIAGVPMRCVGPEATAGNLRARVRSQLAAFTYSDPFTGDPISLAEAIGYCSFWRQLIDSNRGIDSAIGFAFWKRPTVAPLLWSGSGEVRFLSQPASRRTVGRTAVWKARTAPAVLADLERSGADLVEVEDGFIRSAGLGADCVPPLSIVVDAKGAHFDPRQPSELETMLQDGPFDSALLERARQLRELIVESGVSKYASGSTAIERRASPARQILVPGQVEDDRAVVLGGSGLSSNLELLRRVRAQSPDAHILYKPHPDVEAGHRAGSISEEECLKVADEIVRDDSISALIKAVDEVHVNSSLAGFEALLRNKPVTTYGVPFYAGWGLTCDLGPVPARRTARRTLDELVAAVLLLYPRYLDPVTWLPCPPEILISRLSETGSRSGGLVVSLRRLQGRVRRGLSAFWRGR